MVFIVINKNILSYHIAKVTLNSDIFISDNTYIFLYCHYTMKKDARQEFSIKIKKLEKSSFRLSC